MQHTKIRLSLEILIDYHKNSNSNSLIFQISKNQYRKTFLS